MSLLKSLGLVIIIFVSFILIQISSQFVVDIEFMNSRWNEEFINILGYFLNFIFIVILLKLMKIPFFPSINIKRRFSGILFLVLILSFFLRVIVDPLLRYQNIIYTEPINIESNYFLTAKEGFLVLFSNVILIPIVEELIFRKSMIEVIKRNSRSVIVSIMVSSIFFALAHFYPYSSLITSVIFGIVASIIYIEVGLTSAILFHSSYNLIAFILYKYDMVYWNILFSLDFGCWYWSIIILSSIIFICLIKIILSDRNSQSLMPE